MAIQASHQEAGIGEEIEFTVELKFVENYKVCGVQINFGDGNIQYVRVENSPPQLVVKHTYKQAGGKVFHIEGKTRFQGLNTSFPCPGADQRLAINILPEDYSAKRAAALASKQAALEKAQTDERAAQLAANSAKSQRQAAESAAQKARLDRATAEKMARDSANEKLAAQRAAQQQATQKASIKPAPPQTTATPTPAAATPPTAAPSVNPAPTTQPVNKSKSVLDL